MTATAGVGAFAGAASGRRPKIPRRLPDRFANGSITVFTRTKVQTMKTYNFVLHFDLPNAKADPEDYLDALFEAGCDDALVGTGEAGVIALDFSREAEDASSALVSAVSNVLTAIPGARLTEAGPDLLNLSEIAEWISEQVQPVTRQAIRKYAKGALAKTTVRFPAPAVSSSSPVWHLADVLVWMRENHKVDVLKAAPLLESTQVIKTFNAAVSASSLDRARDARLIELAHRVAP
jgi:hypothetical protein